MDLDTEKQSNAPYSILKGYIDYSMAIQRVHLEKHRQLLQISSISYDEHVIIIKGSKIEKETHQCKKNTIIVNGDREGRYFQYLFTAANHQ